MAEVLMASRPFFVILAFCAFMSAENAEVLTIPQTSASKTKPKWRANRAVQKIASRQGCITFSSRQR